MVCVQVEAATERQLAVSQSINTEKLIGECVQVEAAIERELAVARELAVSR